MRAVVQRVTKGKVSVSNKDLGEISNGLVILLGIELGDSQEAADYLSKKIANLRIFSDQDGKMNESILDQHGEAIVVSQFTLMANTKKGNRPSFINAAPPEIAQPLVDTFIEQLHSYGIKVHSGEFGAHMMVEIHNDGPVTIIFDR